MMGEEEADNIPSCNYTLEYVLQLRKITENHLMLQKIMVV